MRDEFELVFLELEQFGAIDKHLSWESQSLIEEHHEVYLFIGPIGLEVGLKVAEEVSCFCEGRLKDIFNLMVLCCIEIVLLYPIIGVEIVLLRGFPVITHHIIPFFQGISIGCQLVMLAPPFKY